jgi:hypothetical protein
MVSNLYSVYHWWDGDAHSDPAWVLSSTTAQITTITELKAFLAHMKALGWTSFRVFKHTAEEIDPETFNA